MVWILSAEEGNAALVPPKYHFTSPGTYKVGRKDGHIILPADKTVSRLHAELIIAPVTPWLPKDSTADVPMPELLLKDYSKFGTFIGKTAGVKPVFSFPDRAVSVKDGDLITFGTVNSTFRLSYLPMVFCVSLLEDKLKDSAREWASSIGAYVSDRWAKCCTHLVVIDGSKVSDDVFLAVIHKRVVVELKWLQAIIARGGPGDDFPAASGFLPTLIFEGHEFHIPVKISEPNVWHAIFQGFDFVIGPSDLYYLGNHLRQILEAAGGEAQTLSHKNEHIQLQSGKKYMVILPDGAVESQSWLFSTAKHYNLSSIVERKIIEAILTGQKEILSTILSEKSSGGQATSSTEETVEVGDSEEDVESVALYSKDIKKIATATINVAVHSTINPLPSSQQRIRNALEQITEDDHGRESQPRFREIFTRKSAAAEKLLDQLVQGKGVKPPSQLVTPLESKAKYITPQVEEAVDTDSVEHSDPSIDTHVEYSCLIVKKDWNKTLSEIAQGGSAPNFKRFRKVGGLSGNSFADLVPFAKEPYRDSDYGREVEEYMQREKKRKEAERLAEDLFTAERLKRQKTTLNESLRDQWAPPQKRRVI